MSPEGQPGTEGFEARLALVCEDAPERQTVIKAALEQIGFAMLAPKKHRTGGTTLPGLGKEFSGLWIGLFNADPSNERSYELSVILRRKPPAEAPRAAIKPPAESPMAGKFFGRKR